MATLDEYRSRVRGRLGIHPGDAILTPEVLADCVNDALRDIAQELPDAPWYERKHAFTTVASTAEYLLPADVRLIRSVAVAGYEWDQGPAVEFDTWENEGTLTDRWYLLETVDDSGEWKSRIGLRPTPTGAHPVVVRYRCWEPRLTAGTDRPLVPDAFEQAIVQGACRYACQVTGELDKQARYAEGFREALRRARSNAPRTPGPRRPRVRP